jgi:hypothetical protein
MRVTVKVKKLGVGLVEAVNFDVPDTLADDMVCDLTFSMLNAQDPAGWFTLTREVIDAYHRQYPSLSVGDIVTVGNRDYRCEAVGWTNVTSTPPDDNPDAGTEEAIEKAEGR